MKIELTKTDRRLSAVRFVVSAIAKESSRYAMTKVQVNADSIVGTDRHRLHVAYLDHAWEPGLYDVLKYTKTSVILLKSEEQLSFPKWQDIVPTYSNYFSSSCSFVPRYELAGDFWIDRNAAVLARLGIGINSDYLAPLADYNDNWQIYYSAYYSPIHAVVNSCHAKCRAVIMPVNMAFNQVRFHRRIVSNIYVQPEAA